MFSKVPPELKPHILDFHCDPRLLWALDLPVERLPARSFLWHLDHPWWKADGLRFAVTPREVLLDPRRHA